MKYQRVLYTNSLTAELKSKLRIVSYTKPRSLKGNVYYVSFASDVDIEYADRISKHLRNVALKPFQPRCAFEAQRNKRMSACNNLESLPLPSVPLSSSSSSSVPCLSLPTALTTLPNSNSTLITSESDSPRQTNETLEERTIGVLSTPIGTCESVPPTPIAETSSSAKEQLINDIQLCLNAIETARRAADELCKLYKRGCDYREAFNYLFQVHSTAFYLKIATSAQIKVAFSTGLRLPWSALANSISALKTDVRHEQSFKALVALDKRISSTIDSTTSITMSSKLAYQLAKLSN